LIRRALPEYDVDLAQSYDDALAKLAAGVIYDVAIVDLNLLITGRDLLGGRLLEIMRDQYPSIRRIALTGLPPTALKAAIFDRYDVDDLLLKQDIDLAALREAVGTALRRTTNDVPRELKAEKSAMSTSLRTWKASVLLRLNRRAQTLENDVLEAGRVGKQIEDSAKELAAIEARKRYLEAECSGVAALVSRVRFQQEMMQASQEFERLKSIFGN
jgi:CheY-like chemotaxis protein